ncbi:MAG: protoglobin domain-containing protein [Planctomycetaceae bacterium]
MNLFKYFAMTMACIGFTSHAAVAQQTPIAGYTYGDSQLPKSPISLEQLAEIQKSLLFTADDEKYLRMSHDVLSSQVEEVLDVWYGFVASTPHLVHYFTDSTTNKPNPEYLGRVRKRFGQWILDTAKANYGQDWLNYQHQIALRHHHSGKTRRTMFLPCHTFISAIWLHCTIRLLRRSSRFLPKADIVPMRSIKCIKLG